MKIQLDNAVTIFIYRRTTKIAQALHDHHDSLLHSCMQFYTLIDDWNIIFIWNSAGWTNSISDRKRSCITNRRMNDMHSVITCTILRHCMLVMYLDIILHIMAGVFMLFNQAHRFFFDVCVPSNESSMRSKKLTFFNNINQIHRKCAKESCKCVNEIRSPPDMR